jgi:hypothetical protein
VHFTVACRFMITACELIHIFLCQKENSTIMLKILGVTVQNLVYGAMSGCRDLFAPNLSPSRSIEVNCAYIN